MSEALRPYTRKTLAWILGLAAGSFVLAIVLSAFSDDLGRPVSAGNNTFSQSALGHQAMLTFLERSGVEVHVRRTERLDNIAPTVPVLAAEPMLSTSDTDEASPAFRRLFEAVRARGAPLIVALPKRVGLTGAHNRRWLERVQTLPRGRVGSLLDYLNGELGLTRDAGFWFSIESRWIAGAENLDCKTDRGEPLKIEIEQPVFLEPSESLEQLVSCPGGWLVAQHEDEIGRLTLVVSDPDILANHGLGAGDNAGLIHQLIVDRLESNRLTVDETIHGFTLNTGLLAEVFRFPLVLALTHGVLALGLILWSGTGRFGKPRPATPVLGSGKGVLIDNTASLLSIAGSTPETLPRYFRQTIRAVAAHYYLPADLPEPALLARLEQIGKARELEFDLSRNRKSMTEMSKQADRAVNMALRLHHWRERMMHVD